ncbi:MAG: cytochrome P450, partial [Acidimicrobiaceae bacterium]|nr:cytochrome P450 [Acidimicrobiaceae bacterium]
MRDNQLSMYSRDFFVNEFVEGRLFFHNFVFLNEPDFIEHILVTNRQNYVKGHLARQTLEWALGNNLLISEGDFWRRQRRIMNPAFHHQHLAQAVHVMVRRARQRVERWRTPCERGERLDIAHEMMSLTMEIVAEALFSSDI